MKIDADIHRARTPDGALYTDPQMFEMLRERVFAPSWQLVTASTLPARRGEAAPHTLLPGCLNEPIAFTHDGDTLRALSNVCTHRGNLVVTAPCEGPTLRCGYHGRRFDLDGRLRAMPGFEGVEGFPSRDDDLTPLALASLGPLRFVSLAPVVSFEAWTRGVSEGLAALPLDRLRYDPQSSAEYTVRAHWMLYTENYLEGFHIPFVHPGLQRVLAPDGYRTELFDWSVVQIGDARGPLDATVPFDRARADLPQRAAAWYAWLFPNLMLNVYPWGISVNVVEPVSPDETRVRYLAWVWDPSLRDTGAGSGLDAVEREDEAVVEAVQLGVRSRLYRGGRYSPAHEAGVHHLHRLIASRLASS